MKTYTPEDGQILEARIEKLEIALQEISFGRGAYDRNQLKHAGNCIENMRSIAVEALAK